MFYDEAQDLRIFVVQNVFFALTYKFDKQLSFFTGQARYVTHRDIFNIIVEIFKLLGKRFVHSLPFLIATNKFYIVEFPVSQRLTRYC